MPPIRVLVAVLALIAVPSIVRAQREKLPPDDYDYVMKTWPNAKVSNTGVRYVINKPGSGPLLQPGDLIKVLYVAKLLHGKVFDQKLDRNKPFVFRVDRAEVIKGWDQVLQIMRPGDEWTVIIPPELAYGRKGYPPAIPSFATLVFDVKILGVVKDG